MSTWTRGLTLGFPFQEQILALVFDQEPRSWIEGRQLLSSSWFQGTVPGLAGSVSLWGAQYPMGMGSLMG